MNKVYVITFSVSVLILASIATVLLLIVLPDNVGLLEGNTSDYTAMSKPKYTYESTKNITTDITQKDYVVTNDQMASYESQYLYIPGNSDPFSPKVTENVSTDTQQNSNTTTGSTNTNAAQEAEDKTTNSNGGIKNPESTGK